MRLPMLAGVALSILVATSCSTTPVEPSRSPAASKKLADALAGRVAGPPQHCIHNFPSAEMQVIDDWTILFDDRRTIYVQNPRGGCSGIGGGFSTLVLRPTGSGQLCSGDIYNVVDLQTQTRNGSCVFSEFVPYTKPKS
jgi:hypothetical protein